MPSMEATTVCWLLGLIQVLGLASGWCVRLSERSPRQTAFQCLFIGYLVLVGGTAIVCVAIGSGYWLLCGTTLLLMVLTATSGPRRLGRAVAW